MQKLTKLETIMCRPIGHPNRRAFYSDTLGSKSYSRRTGITKTKTEDWSQAQSQPERSIV